METLMCYGQAKDKEQAVFLLYRIYDLAPVRHENLRPEKPQKVAQVLNEDEDAAVAEGADAGDDNVGAKTSRPTRPRRAVEGSCLQRCSFLSSHVGEPSGVGRWRCNRYRLSC